VTEPTPGAPYREHLDQQLVDRHLARVEARWEAVRAGLGDPTRDADESARTAEAAAACIPTLLRLIRAMRPGYALLGHARRVLDDVAEYGTSAQRAAAENLSQRIVDEIGHPATDEPACGPELRDQVVRLTAENARLRLKMARDEVAQPHAGWRTAVLRSAELAVDAGHEVTIVAPASGHMQISARRPGSYAALEIQIETLRRERRAQSATIVELRDLWIAEQDRDHARLLADLSLRQVADLKQQMDAERSAAWLPRAYQSRPLTPEQERSVERNECRTDWPVMVQPCDPRVTADGDEMLVACAKNRDADPIFRGRGTWSALVAKVSTHRCTPTANSGPACCGGGDCAGKCEEVPDAGAA